MFLLSYWKNKKFEVTLCKIDYVTEIVFRLTLWWLEYFPDRDEECLKAWKHFTIFCYKTKESKRRKQSEKRERLEDMIDKL